MYLLTLNKKNIALSIAEALIVLRPKKHQLIDDYLLIEGISFFKKLKIKRSSFGLIKSINKVFAIKNNASDLKIDLSKINLKKYYKKDLKVECKGFGKENSKLTKLFASIIIRKLKGQGINPVINIKKPKTLISIKKGKTKYFITQTIWKNQDDTKKRENKELPEKMPTTISPKMAKAMINLSSKTKGKLIDPFCGAGGILIEAARLGFKVTGYDIDKRAIGKAKLNLLHLGINNVHLEMRDALSIDKKYDCIITDLPFGKNSKISKEMDELYVQFLTKALKHTKEMVIGFPATFNRDLIPKQWKIIDFFELYVHKSMSKVICILEKK